MQEKVFVVLFAGAVVCFAAEPITAFIMDQNVEHTRSAVQGGLSAQLVRNRKFAGRSRRTGVAMMWEPCGAHAFYHLLLNLGLTRHAARSRMPRDNFLGMRADVVEHLREIGTSVIRWPGGNFAGEYRWRDGLIADPDERAPLQSRNEIKTHPYTIGYDSNDIGMEHILALCEKIGAQPFFTINIAWDSPKDSADWVRACRGRVKLWGLGNEMGHGHMEGVNGPQSYTNVAIQHAEEILGLKCVCYFQAINEQAICVNPFESHLTAAGEAMRLWKGHVGGVPAAIPDLPDNVFATDHPEGTRYMTFYNNRPADVGRCPVVIRRMSANGFFV